MAKYWLTLTGCQQSVCYSVIEQFFGVDVVILTSLSFLSGFPWPSHFDLVFVALPNPFLSVLALLLPLRHHILFLLHSFSHGITHSCHCVGMTWRGVGSIWFDGTIFTLNCLVAGWSKIRNLTSYCIVTCSFSKPSFPVGLVFLLMSNYSRFFLSWCSLMAYNLWRRA